jgi:hypothetical protein
MLVNGNCDGDKLSPLSFACGIFATSLGSFNGALVLSFFCGMHLSERTEEVGAGHMLVSLISQLLMGYHQFDFKFRKSWGYKNAHLEINSPSRMDALCALFCELVRQLPEDRIVFCLLDGIQYYELDDRREDTYKAIYQILELMFNGSIKAMFKLLIATPARSTAVYNIIPPENIWLMPVEIDRTDQGFDAKKAMLETSKSIGPEGSSINNYVVDDRKGGSGFVDDEDEQESSGVDTNYSGDSDSSYEISLEK